MRSNYLCVALLHMALHCASPSPTHMTPKSSSARIRPTAAHFFDQLKRNSPSQAPTVPPSAAVPWVSDSWLSSGTKRRAIDNTDDDPVYDEFIRYCAPIAASGKVLHESSPSIDVTSFQLTLLVLRSTARPATSTFNLERSRPPRCRVTSGACLGMTGVCVHYRQRPYNRACPCIAPTTSPPPTTVPTAIPTPTPTASPPSSGCTRYPQVV